MWLYCEKLIKDTILRFASRELDYFRQHKISSRNLGDQSYPVSSDYKLGLHVASLTREWLFEGSHFRNEIRIVSSHQPWLSLHLS